jgi:hypothetical protein
MVLRDEGFILHCNFYQYPASLCTNNVRHNGDALSLRFGSTDRRENSKWRRHVARGSAASRVPVWLQPFFYVLPALRLQLRNPSPQGGQRLIAKPFLHPRKHQTSLHKSLTAGTSPSIRRLPGSLSSVPALLFPHSRANLYLLPVPREAHPVPLTAHSLGERE